MRDTRIAELIIKQQKELAALKEQITEEKFIARAFPGLNIEKVYKGMRLWGSDLTIILAKVSTLNEAIEQAEKLNPLSIVKFKGGCTAFVPETWEEQYSAKNPNAEGEHVGPYIYEIDSIRRDEKKLVYYIQLRDKKKTVVRVYAPCEDNDTRRFPRKSRKRDKDWSIEHKSGIFRSKIKWASGGDEYPNSFTLYNP